MAEYERDRPSLLSRGIVFHPPVFILLHQLGRTPSPPSDSPPASSGYPAGQFSTYSQSHPGGSRSHWHMPGCRSIGGRLYLCKHRYRSNWQEGKMERWPWCLGNEKMIRYYDEEWGVLVHDDRKQFEFLMMDVMQCDLNWIMMIQKREIF